MPASEQQAMKRQTNRKHNAAQVAEQSFLVEYTPPLMDGGIHDELLDIVNLRKAEDGAPTDF